MPGRTVIVRIFRGCVLCRRANCPFLLRSPRWSHDDPRGVRGVPDGPASGQNIYEFLLGACR